MIIRESVYALNHHKGNGLTYIMIFEHRVNRQSLTKEWLRQICGTSRNKANLRDLIAATGLVILLKLDSNRWFSSKCDLKNWCMTSKNNRAPSILHQVFRIISNPSDNLNWSYSPETLNSPQSAKFLSCVTLKFDMTLRNNTASFLYHVKLCASFQSRGWIQTGVTVRKCQFRIKIGYILARVTLTFDGWPWKSIGHTFYFDTNFVHHFIAISEFKLELHHFVAIG